MNLVNGGFIPQHILLFGPPFVGKTTLIGTATEEYDILFFDLEQSIKALLKLPIEQQHKITLIPVMDTIENPRAIKLLDKVLKGGTFKTCDGHGELMCPACLRAGSTEWTEFTIPTSLSSESSKLVVAIDSGSQLTISANTATNILIKNTTTPEFMPVKEGRDGYAEWGGQGKMLTRILSVIQNAPYHVIMTAHESEGKREDDSLRISPSIGTAAYGVNCGKYFDHVIYMDKINGKHVAYSDTGFSNKIITGSRTDIAIEGMEVPSLLPFLRGEHNVGKDSNGVIRTQQARQVLSQVQSSDASEAGAGTKQPFKFASK
jgi:hypothetical protein